MQDVSKDSENIVVCHVDPWVMTTLSALAKHAGISLESYIKGVLQETVLQATLTEGSSRLYSAITEKQDSDILASGVDLVIAVREESIASCL
ncbi:MAG: hypothetical protein ABG776_17980 [Cyanobacteria bacterium J06555_13]